MINIADKLILILLFFFIGCSSQKEYVPQSIFGLSLVQKLEGESAASFVDRLHYNEVAAEKNEIGFYKADHGEAIIYVSYYKNVKDAELNLKLMVEKISPENSVFTGGESFEMNDTKIYRYLGMGQTHFVFANKKALLWLSAEINWGEKFLNEYLSFLN